MFSRPDQRTHWDTLSSSQQAGELTFSRYSGVEWSGVECTGTNCGAVLELSNGRSLQYSKHGPTDM